MTHQRRFLPLILIAACLAFVAERSDAAEKTMADILPADACQPCHQTVPKLKLLPRDVRTLFKGQRTANSSRDLDKILQQMRSTILVLAFGQKTKALRLDPERRIELAAEILKRDRCGQLDDLRLGVVLFQPGKQGIVDLLICKRDPLGIFERSALGLAE